MSRFERSTKLGVFDWEKRLMYYFDPKRICFSFSFSSVFFIWFLLLASDAFPVFLSICRYVDIWKIMLTKNSLFVGLFSVCQNMFTKTKFWWIDLKKQNGEKRANRTKSNKSISPLTLSLSSIWKMTRICINISIHFFVHYKLRYIFKQNLFLMRKRNGKIDLKRLCLHWTFSSIYFNLWLLFKL